MEKPLINNSELLGDIEIHRITSPEELITAFKITEAYLGIREESLPENIDEWQPKNIDCCYYLCAIINGEIGGVIYFYPINYTLYQIHIALSPSCRGIDTPAIVKSAIEWLYTNTTCATMVAIIPKTKSHVVNLAKRCDFNYGGFIPHAYFQKGAGLIDCQLYYRACEKCLA